MNPIEKSAMKAVVTHVTRDSMDKGILTAVEMIRMAAVARPDMTLTELADVIESTVSKGGEVAA